MATTASGLEPPQVVLNIDPMAGFVDPDARIHTRTQTIDEAISGDFSPEKVARLHAIAKVLPSGSIEYKKKVYDMAYHFVQLHKEGKIDGLTNGLEYDKETLAERLAIYLTMRISASLKKDRLSGEPLKNKAGNLAYMSYSHLLHLTSIACSVGFFLCLLSPVEDLCLRRALADQVVVLQTTYKLEDHARTKVLYTPEDVRALIETAYKYHDGASDMAIQFHVMILLFFFTGARAGSLVSTPAYVDEFLTWKDLVLVPVRDPVDHAIISFQVNVTLVAFKGYHSGHHLSLTFKIGSPKSDKYGVLDLAAPLIAMGLRRGVFGDSVMFDDLMRSSASEIRCDPAFDDTPVMYNRQSNMQLSDRPLNKDTGNRWLQRISKVGGMHTGEPFANTLYALRRGFATALSKNFNKDVARRFLAHRPNSTMLERRYDQSEFNLNMVQGVLGPGEGAELGVVPVSYRRSSIKRQVPTVEEVLKLHPRFRHFSVKLNILTACIEAGSMAWTTISPWKEWVETFPENSPPSQRHLIAQIAYYRSQLLTIVRIVRGKTEKTELVSFWQEATDYAIILERQKEFSEPSPLALALQARILLLEKNYAAKANDPAFAPTDKRAYHFTVKRNINAGIQDDEGGEFGEFEDEDAVHLEDVNGMMRDDDDEDSGGAQSDPVQPDEDEGSLVGATGSLAPLTAIDIGSIQAQLSTANMSTPITTTPAVIVTKTPLLLLLKSIATLPAYKDDVFFCQKCLDDPTADKERKEKAWRKVDRTKFASHDLRYHNDNQYASRWVGMRVVTNADSTRVFTCPILKQSGIKCGFVIKIRDTGNTAVYKHIAKVHKGDVEDRLFNGTDLDLREKTREFIRQTGKASVPLRSFERRGAERFGLVGTFGAPNIDDHGKSWGLGSGLTDKHITPLRGPTGALLSRQQRRSRLQELAGPSGT